MPNSEIEGFSTFKWDTIFLSLSIRIKQVFTYKKVSSRYFQSTTTYIYFLLTWFNMWLVLIVLLIQDLKQRTNSGVRKLLHNLNVKSCYKIIWTSKVVPKNSTACNAIISTSLCTAHLQISINVANISICRKLIWHFAIKNALVNIFQK